MKLRARILADYVADDGVLPAGEDLVQLQAWIQGGTVQVVQLDDLMAGKTGLPLLERFLAIAADSKETPFYFASVLTVQQALMVRRFFLEFQELVDVHWGGWMPADAEVPHFGLKEQALLGTVKMFLRRSAA